MIADMQTADMTSTEAPAPALVLNRDRLSQLRKAHGIESEAELARVIGVNFTTLYRVSENRTVPSNEFIAKVLSTFPAIRFEELFVLSPAHKVAA
jgi:DNA-binding XRE family transcriptional regulator